MLKKLLFSIIALLMTSGYINAQNVNVTFTVQNPDSMPVYVFGSWSGWGNWPGDPLYPIGNNQYSNTISIPANTQFEFLYVNGKAPYAKETLNPAWACTNGNATYTNRKILSVSADTNITYVWASCNTATHPVKHKFTVEKPDSTTVFLAGSWNGWVNWPGIPMTMVDPTHYTMTINLAANDTVEYLYVNGTPPQKEILNPAWACTNHNGQYTNRLFVTGTTKDSSCNKFGLCDTCGAVTPANINVTFQVQGPPDTTVYVFGSWSGWTNHPGTKMTYAGNNTWKTTISMGSMRDIEFKYINGRDTTYEVLQPTWPCTNGNTTYTNRKITLGAADTSFCARFSSCDACVPQAVTIPSKINTKLIANSNGIQVLSDDISSFDRLDIYDMTGRLIYGVSDVHTNNLYNFNLQNDIPYLVSLRTGTEVLTFKVVLH